MEKLDILDFMLATTASATAALVVSEAEDGDEEGCGGDGGVGEHERFGEIIAVVVDDDDDDGEIGGEDAAVLRSLTKVINTFRKTCFIIFLLKEIFLWWVKLVCLRSNDDLSSPFGYQQLTNLNLSLFQVSEKIVLLFCSLSLSLFGRRRRRWMDGWMDGWRRKRAFARLLGCSVGGVAVSSQAAMTAGKDGGEMGRHPRLRATF